MGICESTWAGGKFTHIGSFQKDHIFTEGPNDMMMGCLKSSCPGTAVQNHIIVR